MLCNCGLASCLRPSTSSGYSEKRNIFDDIVRYLFYPSNQLTSAEHSEIKANSGSTTHSSALLVKQYKNAVQMRRASTAVSSAVGKVTASGISTAANGMMLCSFIPSSHEKKKKRERCSSASRKRVKQG